jgi:hypothetical protein
VLYSVLLVGAVIGVLLAYDSLPTTQLAAAQARWAANGTSNYRIVVAYSVPLYECEQDFEVRGGKVSYRYRDECPTNPVAGASGGLASLYTVQRLFERIDDTLKGPACGPNGCICDGPIQLDVSYHPQLGYPQRITWALGQEQRWRYIDFWLAQLSGRAQCPPVTYIGETIEVLSLEMLPPEATPEVTPNIDALAEPQATKPAVTPPSLGG